MEYKILGQSIKIGEYTGKPTDRTAIKENGTAFSVLNFIMEHGGFVEDSGVWVCQDSSGNNIFGLGYCHTSNDGLRCFIKIADTERGFLSDSETIPLSAPYNGWIMLGTMDPTYYGIEDTENMTLQDLVLNSFTIFTQDLNLYPYYDGGVGVERTAEWCRDYAPADFIIVMGLKNYDATSYVDYTGPTPLRLVNSAWTNWLDNSTVSDPSYSLGDIGYGSKYAYSPLNIRDAQGITEFAEDFSTPAGALTPGYGYSGDSSFFDDIISLSAIDTGFLTLFIPTKTQCRNLADYMWSSDFVDNLKKLYADPMDSIISMAIFPLDLNSYTESVASNVIIGNIDTGVDMYKALGQYYTLDMGHIEVNENWQNALDYASTRVSLYLPFIGFVPMSISDVMGCRITIRYHIDLLSGDCIAKVHCRNIKTKFSNNSAVMYQHHGNCKLSVPINGANYGRMYASLLTAPISAAASIAGGKPGDVIKSVTGAIGSVIDGPDIQRSGSYSGTIAGFNQMTPMLILERLNQQLPARYGEFIGYPAYITETLGDLTGYTVVDSVIDNTVAAPDDEKAEIERLLKEGVLI